MEQSSMQFRSNVLCCLAATGLFAGSAWAQAPVTTSANALTIYSSVRPGALAAQTYRHGVDGQQVPGYAVVRHERPIALERGRNTVRFTDVAALIDPTTVAFESLTDPTGTRVIEQNFQFDLVNSAKLLQKYIDRSITVAQVRGTGVETYTGTLLSTTDGIVLKRADGTIQLLPSNAGVTLPELPGGLITRPTLVWDIAAERAAAHAARVSYQTTGITWWADYNATYAESAGAQACRLDVAAWVSVLNQSGASYPDSKLKLVAGNVHRAPPPGRVSHDAMMARAASVAEAKPAGFEEKSFFEYHLYTLGRPTTLPDNSTKQIELFPAARNVPCEKTLVYAASPAPYPLDAPLTDRDYGVASNRKVDVYLMFRNAKESNMGMPLPAGRIRVSKVDDADATLEFIGEDRIDHTPANEKVLIKLGSAFDVVGERRQVSFSVDTSRKTMTEEIEVRIRNQKTEPASVIVKETLYRWVNARITQSSHRPDKQDARTVHFPLKLAAGREEVVRYTVQYSW
jgi:hypothetical protein